MKLPGTLDVLLRDMHLLWCQEGGGGCPEEWSLADSYPENAARTLAMAIWQLADDPTDAEYAVLQRLNDMCVDD